MSDVAESLAIAERFAALARKNDPADFEVVIHAAYFSMHHAARAALIAAHGSASTNHGRVLASFAKLAAEHDAATGLANALALQAAYDLRIISDYGRAGRELTGEAAELTRQMNEFLDFCRRIASA